MLLIVHILCSGVKYMPAKLCDLQMKTGQATNVEECVHFLFWFLSDFS